MKEAPAKREAISKRRDDRSAPLHEQLKQINDKITGSSTVLEYNPILIRVAASLLIVFLVQTFITIFRYMTRLSAYYQARLDALALADGSDIGIDDFQKMASLLSPESYDFGRLPKTPAEQAIDLAKTLISSQRKAEQS